MSAIRRGDASIAYTRAGAGHAVTIQCADGITALLADHLAAAERRAGERAP